MEDFDLEKSEYAEKVKKAIINMSGTLFEFTCRTSKIRTVPSFIKEIGIPTSRMLFDVMMTRKALCNANHVLTSLASTTLDNIIEGISWWQVDAISKGIGSVENYYFDNIWIYNENDQSKAVLLSRELMNVVMNIPDSVKVFIELSNDIQGINKFHTDTKQSYDFGVDVMGECSQLKWRDALYHLDTEDAFAREEYSIIKITYYLVKAILERDPDALSRDRVFKRAETTGAICELNCKSDGYEEEGTGYFAGEGYDEIMPDLEAAYEEYIDAKNGGKAMNG